MLPRINRTRTSVSNALFETPEANSTSHRLRTASISIVTHSRLAQGPHTAPLRPTRNRGAARCPPAAIGANWCRQPKTRSMRRRASPRAAARPRAVPARHRSRHAAPRPRRRPKHTRAAFARRCHSRHRAAQTNTQSIMSGKGKGGRGKGNGKSKGGSTSSAS